MGERLGERLVKLKSERRRGRQAEAEKVTYWGVHRSEELEVQQVWYVRLLVLRFL